MFSNQSDNCIPFVHIFYIISLFVIKLEEPKIGISRNGLNNNHIKNTSFSAPTLGSRHDQGRYWCCSVGYIGFVISSNNLRGIGFGLGFFVLNLCVLL